MADSLRLGAAGTASPARRGMTREFLPVVRRLPGRYLAETSS